MAKYTINREKMENMMLDQGKTVPDMLKLAGISRAKWQRITTNEQKTSFPNITAIAYALGTDPYLLIAERDYGDC